MKKKEVLNIIQKATQAMEEFFSIPKVEGDVFESAKVKDGDQMVNYSALEVGASVEISTPDGSVPATDGQWDLENGVSFETKDGVITNIISDGQPEDAPVEETPIQAEQAPAPNPVDEKIAGLEAKVAELEGIISEMKSAMEASATKEDFSALTEEIKGLNKAVNVLATTPEEFSKVDKSNEAKDEKLDRLNALASIMGNRK